MSISVGKVAMIQREKIVVSDRARQEYGDLEELESSLKTDGLIQPLAVAKVDDEKFRLLAGERRFLVLEKNGVDEIPVRIFSDELSDIEMKSIELSENFYRKDFEYWEKDALIKEIHQLKQEIHGVKGPGPDSKGHGLNDTAALAGTTRPHVSTAIKRAEAREAFPELFENCKTQKDASKILKKMDEALVKETIAAKLAKEDKSKTFNQIAKCFVIGDFFESVKQIPDGIMHLVEIDPPYAIDLNQAKKADGESKYIKDNYNEVPKDEYQVFLSNLFAECYRVMSDHSWLICWFAPEPWFDIIYQELSNNGFDTLRMCGIWTKPGGQSKRPEMHLANSYEMFFYAWKGRPALNKPGRSNNFNFPPVPPNQKVHPTERPIELMKELYDTFAFPGSRVLIPFLGSGNGILAAHQLGLSPIGFELSKSYKDSFLIKAHNMFK